MPEPGADDLLERLGSHDRGEQRGACEEVIALLSRDPSLHAKLVRILEEGPPRARFSTAYVLFHSGRATLRLLPALLDALELDDGDLRWSAAHMLSLLGRSHGEVLPVVLHEARSTGRSRRRRMAVYVLRELAPDHEATRDAILEAIEDPDPSLRRAALSSLAKLLDPDSRCAERVLAVLRSDSDPRMRRIAAVLLPDLVAKLPEVRSSARMALAEASQADDSPLARAAAVALTRLGEVPGGQFKNYSEN